jgi:hypothetical protein
MTTFIVDALTLAEGRSQNVSNPSKTVSNTLNLNFLGAPEVLYQGRPLKFRSRKVLALLIFLVVEGGHHRREKLITLLWPESGPKQGGATLRSSLARLRKTLAVAGEFMASGKKGPWRSYKLPWPPSVENFWRDSLCLMHRSSTSGLPSSGKPGIAASSKPSSGCLGCK